jgi:hypothetical protein
MLAVLVECGSPNKAFYEPHRASGPLDYRARDPNRLTHYLRPNAITR